jgi:hypothetical protein
MCGSSTMFLSKMMKTFTPIYTQPTNSYQPSDRRLSSLDDYEYVNMTSRPYTNHHTDGKERGIYIRCVQQVRFILGQNEGNVNRGLALADRAREV